MIGGRVEFHDVLQNRWMKNDEEPNQDDTSPSFWDHYRHAGLADGSRALFDLSSRMPSRLTETILDMLHPPP